MCICLHVPIGEITASLALSLVGSQVAAMNPEFRVLSVLAAAALRIAA